MRDYKLSEIKNLCQKYYNKDAEACLDCPLWEWPDSCSIKRMTQEIPQRVPKDWWVLEPDVDVNTSTEVSTDVVQALQQIKDFLIESQKQAANVPSRAYGICVGIQKAIDTINEAIEKQKGGEQ